MMCIAIDFGKSYNEFNIITEGDFVMGFLTGKTAIITGGGRAVLSDGRCGSIGYGIATAYAKEGANLVITGRNMQKLEDAKEELERLYGIEVLAVQADVSAGADNSAALRAELCRALELPEDLTAKAMLEALNMLVGYSEYKSALLSLKERNQ